LAGGRLDRAVLWTGTACVAAGGMIADRPAWHQTRSACDGRQRPAARIPASGPGFPAQAGAGGRHLQKRRPPVNSDPVPIWQPRHLQAGRAASVCRPAVQDAVQGHPRKAPGFRIGSRPRRTGAETGRTYLCGRRTIPGRTARQSGSGRVYGKRRDR